MSSKLNEAHWLFLDTYEFIVFSQKKAIETPRFAINCVNKVPSTMYDFSNFLVTWLVLVKGFHVKGLQMRSNKLKAKM